MCFEETNKKIKPFNRGYKVMRKIKKGGYIGDMIWFSPSTKPRPARVWLDEMPYRPDCFLLENYAEGMGWHIFSTIEQARKWIKGETDPNVIIARVECYGHEYPYGLGVAVNGQPAGRFQFMKILEEIK